MCLLVLLGWVLLSAADLISPGPGWRVRVSRWARPLDGFCGRCPFRAIGRKLSGHGMLRFWNGARGSVLGTLALNRLPSLQGNYTYLALNLCRAPWWYYGQKHSKTFFTPFGFFLVSHNPLMRFWGKMLWHLWIGRARHPEPGLNNLGIELLVCGGGLSVG